MLQRLWSVVFDLLSSRSCANQPVLVRNELMPTKPHVDSVGFSGDPYWTLEKFMVQNGVSRVEYSGTMTHIPTEVPL